jgi:hypothetical protein
MWSIYTHRSSRSTRRRSFLWRSITALPTSFHQPCPTTTSVGSTLLVFFPHDTCESFITQMGRNQKKTHISVNICAADAKPFVLLLGQYSVGKTSFINHLLGETKCTKKSKKPNICRPLCESLFWPVLIIPHNVTACTYIPTEFLMYSLVSPLE